MASTNTDPTAYPYEDVVYIETSFAGLGTFRGTGVIIGPHTILTASHMVWNSQAGEAASTVVIHPEDSTGPSGATLPGTEAWHYNPITYTSQNLPPDQSQSDFAIIDTSTDLSAYGYFGVLPNYAGGTVHVTGYPAVNPGFYSQTDQVGTASVDPNYSIFDWGNGLNIIPGNSGGPVWIDEGTPGNPLPYVVGVVSSTGHGVQLTSADWQTILGWEHLDTQLWNPSITFTNGVSLTSNEQVAEALYVAYFDRAADPAGLNYWISNLVSGQPVENLALNFAKQVETQNLYSFIANPTINSDAARGSFVSSIYSDLFNRAPDASGLAYWKAELLHDQQTLHGDTLSNAIGNFILEVIRGAQNTASGQDITSIQDKITVASYFTDHVSAQGLSWNGALNSEAHTVVAGTGSALSSVALEEHVIDAFLAAHPASVAVAGIVPDQASLV